MAETVSCGFGRVFLCQTKTIALSIIKQEPNESQTKFKCRLLQERFRIFTEHFKEYPRFDINKGKNKFISLSFW